MGCDIHLYKEKRVDGQWVTADEGWWDEHGEGVDVPWEKRFTERNYKLFGVLSKGVRYECEFSIEARGFPVDASFEVAKVYEMWGCDAHSASYLTLSELKALQARFKDRMMTITGMKDKTELAALRESIDSGSPDWNLLYPYCGGSSSPDYVNFSIQVPVEFIIGDGVTRIIDSFDGIDGGDHRIVFFFDN